MKKPKIITSKTLQQLQKKVDKSHAIREKIQELQYQLYEMQQDHEWARIYWDGATDKLTDEENMWLGRICTEIQTMTELY